MTEKLVVIVFCVIAGIWLIRLISSAYAYWRRAASAVLGDRERDDAYRQQFARDKAIQEQVDLADYGVAPVVLEESTEDCPSGVMWSCRDHPELLCSVEDALRLIGYVVLIDIDGRVNLYTMSPGDPWFD